MGLRGSRVQIPPSRLLTEPGAVGGRFLPRMPPTSRKLALLAHDGGKRFVIRLVVALEESSRGGTRTPDPPVNSRLLYQLSYSGRGAKYRDAEQAAPRASPEGCADGAPVPRRTIGAEPVAELGIGALAHVGLHGFPRAGVVLDTLAARAD